MAGRTSPLYRPFRTMKTMDKLSLKKTAKGNRTLTAVPGIRVGHWTLAERPTGCTVVLCGAGAVAGVDVRGASPGTRETDLLNPVNSVQQVHAVVLSGGSAFGLDTASGVMQYLDEKNIGFKAGPIITCRSSRPPSSSISTWAGIRRDPSDRGVRGSCCAGRPRPVRSPRATSARAPGPRSGSLPDRAAP